MAILVSVYVLYFHGLGHRDLWNSHEARAALNARSILAGDWLVPCLPDGRPELQKPPLYYWSVAVFAALTGAVDAWTVRLPAALSGILCLAVLVWFGVRLGRLREGLLAAFVLGTAFHFTWLARVGRIDIPLTLTTTFALACLYLSQGSERVACLAGAYIALGLSLLLKGPIGIVLVGTVMAVFLLGEGRLISPLRLLHDYGVWWGVPLMFALALPWFLVANSATEGELGRVFFWYHNVERGLGGASLRGHPWWFYGPRFGIDFAPWSILLPVCLWLRRHWREDREARFGLAWLAGMMLVLSCARYKRADYLVPAYPGAALFLACVLSKVQTNRARQLSMGVWLRRLKPQASLVFLGAVLTLGWWVRVEVILPGVEETRELHSFASVIGERVPSSEPLLFFHLEGHLLAHHLGRPVSILRHWHELDSLLVSAHIVMPAAQAKEWRQHLRRAELDELARNTPGHEKPLVLFRLVPRSSTTTRNPEDADHAGPARAATNRDRAAQPRTPGTQRQSAAR